MSPEENRAYHREYYRTHADHLRAASRSAYANNPELRKNKSERSRTRRDLMTPEQLESYRRDRAEKSRTYRKENPEKNRETVLASISRKLARFNLLKMDRPCYDCGGQFAPESMDWDHRPGQVKKFDVAEGVRSRSDDEVMEEINKCQLVCANCHRVRTKARAQQKG